MTPQSLEQASIEDLVELRLRSALLQDSILMLMLCKQELQQQESLDAAHVERYTKLLRVRSLQCVANFDALQHLINSPPLGDTITFAIHFP